MIPKKCIILFILSFITISIAGCQAALNDQREEAKVGDADISKDLRDYQQADNHIGNLINGGFVTKEDDWLYYSNSNDGGKIYKVHLDGGEHIKVNNEQSSKMTIIGDWIYYLGRGENIYKIRTDGSERTLLFDDYSWELFLHDDWIYYASFGHGITKMQASGSRHKKIRDYSGLFFHLIDDWLYFIDDWYWFDYGIRRPDKPRGRIKKVSTDGGKSKIIVDEDVFAFNIVDGWIYYSSPKLGITKTRIDVNDETKIIDDRSFELNVVGDWIYYINENDSSSIYRIRTDGSERTKLNDDESSNIIVIGDWIYYKDVQRDEDHRIINEEIYKIRTDGSEQVKFEMAEPEIREDDHEDYYVAVDEGKHLFIRQSYGKKDKSSDNIIDQLPRGRLLKIIENYDNKITEDDYTWWEARDPQTGISGWLAAEYLRRELPEQYDESNDYGEEKKYHPEQERRGNTVGNIINRGFVAEYNDWIFVEIPYYNEHLTTDSDIYKNRSGGNDLTQVIDGYAWSNGGINVVGDWLYFTTGRMPFLRKIRTDGSDLVEISGDDHPAEVTVIDDWVYYLGRDENIYKIRTDGSDRNQLNDNHSKYLNVVEDWIYFSNGDDGYNIYKMRTDGSELNKINNDYSKYINVVGDWIYYCNGSDGFVIYKIRTDGSERTKVSKDVVGTINVYNNWIYYTNLDDNSAIYKIRTDGTGRIQLNNEHSAYLNIADNWIYYYVDLFDPYTIRIDLYKIRIDGSSRQRVN